MLLLFMTALAMCLGVVFPLRWGIFGFLAAAIILFALQAGINFFTGFEGTSIQESLLLFNGSWMSYLGFNLQITYRAFALPLLALSALIIYRSSRAPSQ